MRHRRWLAFAATTVICGAAFLHAEPTTPSSHPLVIVTRAEWGSKPMPIPESRRQVPKLITIHHAGELWKPTDEPFKKMLALQRFSQVGRPADGKPIWLDVPYHYCIAPDGRVFEGRDVTYEPDSNTNYSLNGVLNIELMGNFEEQRVSVEQLRATAQLIAKLCEDLKLDVNTMRGHGDAAKGQTVCPGADFKRYLSGGQLRAWVDAYREGKEADVELLPELSDGPTTMIATTRPS